MQDEKLLSRIVITPSARIRDAMAVIDQSGLEIALVVDSNRRLLGILTDGDVRRGLLGGATLESSVEPIIREDFIGVGPTEGRAVVLDLMRARTLRHIPIVDEAGILVGLHLLRELIGAVERPNWAVVMAGGKGERLRPLTDTIPKPMVPVAGRPILERIILHLVGFGFRRVFLSVGYLSQVIEDHFGSGTKLGCSIEYLREEKPLGTGGSLSLLPARPDHPLLVLNGDLLTQIDVGEILPFHEQGGFVATVGLREYVHTVPYGVAEVKDNQIVDLREKPSQTWRANCGIYVVQPQLVDRVPKGTYFNMPRLIEDCLERREPVGAFEVEDDWMDVGRHRELRRARGEGPTS